MDPQQKWRPQSDSEIGTFLAQKQKERKMTADAGKLIRLTARGGAVHLQLLFSAKNKEQGERGGHR